MPKIVKYLLGLAVMAFTSYYFYSNPHIIQSLSKISLYNLIILCFIASLMLISTGVNFLYQIKLFNLAILHLEVYLLAYANTLYNLILPAKGGLLARAYYLKKKYQFSYAKYSAMIGVSMFFGFTLNSGLASLILLIDPNKTQLPDWFLFSCLGLFAVFSVLLISIYRFKNLADRIIDIGWTKIDDFIRNMLNGVHHFKQNKSALVGLLFSQLIMTIFMGFRLWYSAKAINLEVDIFYAIAVQAIIGISLFISLTPGNIGIKEGIIIYLLLKAGMSQEEAVLIATIDRIASVIVIFLFGIPSHFILIRDKKI